MSRRDLFHLAGLALILAAIWWASQKDLVALANSVKATNDTAALKARVEHLESRIQQLEKQALERQAYWDTLSRQVDDIERRIE